MMLRYWGAVLALLLPSLACGEARPLSIRVEGSVQAPGARELPSGSRLAEAMLRARPLSEAFLLGASFQREQARQQQQQQRAGLAYDLQALQALESPGIAATAAALSLWLQQHPATGRTLIAAPARLLQVQPQLNPVLADGDRLIIPARPTHVQVIGAVAQPCSLPHAPARDALDYLRDCPAAASADPSDLYVIQPDGQVQQLGIALWNRADPQAVGPGGTLYVPMRTSSIVRVDPAFNREFAAFIATQPVTP